MAAEIGSIFGDDHQMAGAPLDGLVAARADVALERLVGLDPAHLDGISVGVGVGAVSRLAALDPCLLRRGEAGRLRARPESTLPGNLVASGHGAGSAEEGPDQEQRHNDQCAGHHGDVGR